VKEMGRKARTETKGGDKIWPSVSLWNGYATVDKKSVVEMVERICGMMSKDNRIVLNCEQNSTTSKGKCESKKIPPLRFCRNFSKTVGNFSTKLYTPIMRSYLR